jgi:plastocyanin
VKRPALACLLVALLVAGASCSGSKPDVTVRMVDFTFKPVHIVVVPGQAVRFTNDTSHLHNFTVLHGPAVSLDVPAGSNVTTEEIGALKPGTYPFRCKYHFRQGMIGVLTVEGPSS